MSKEEAHLLLTKWYEEKSPLYMVLRAANFPTTHTNMPGVITQLEPDLIISHTRGSSDGFLKCSWTDIESFEYSEMREDVDRLAGRPGAAEFMRNRSILAINAKGGLLIRLVDLTLPY